MFDVVDCGSQHALVQGADAARHLIWRQAGVGPCHSDDGNTDFGKNISGGFQCCERPQYQQQQGHHHKRIRALDRQANNIQRHLYLSSLATDG